LVQTHLHTSRKKGIFVYTHWLNGNLTMEPENDSERKALLLLWQNAKQGPPPYPEASKGGGGVGSTGAGVSVQELNLAVRD
jgi:hypothetical protein